MTHDPRRIDVSRRGSGMLALVALGLMAVFVLGIFIYVSRPVGKPDMRAAANASAPPGSPDPAGGGAHTTAPSR